MSLLASLRDRWAIRRDPVAWARSVGVRVGERCRFIGVTTATFGSEPYLVRIGHHVTLTAGVIFVTHDGGVWVFRDDFPDLDVIAPIDVRDNVFLGVRTIVLPGVTIGPNAVVGAGSVVNRDIPPNSVAAGVPARVVSTLASYRERALASGKMIRLLSPTAKREFLEGAFGEPR